MEGMMGYDEDTGFGFDDYVQGELKNMGLLPSIENAGGPSSDDESEHDDREVAAASGVQVVRIYK